MRNQAIWPLDMATARIRTNRFRPKNHTLCITCCYPEVSDSGLTMYYIRPGEEIFGVPYIKWLQHVNQEVDLSTWEGTGTSMIGGLKKIEIDIILYDGILTSYYLDIYDIKEIEEEVKRLQYFLKDEVYEINPDTRKDIRGYINEGKRAIARLKKEKN